MLKRDLERAEEPKNRLPISVGSQKKEESSRKASALFSMLKPWTLDHNKLWKIIKKTAIPDHLICLLRNLYAGQEVTE